MVTFGNICGVFRNLFGNWACIKRRVGVALSECFSNQAGEAWVESPLESLKKIPRLECGEILKLFLYNSTASEAGVTLGNLKRIPGLKHGELLKH